MTAYLSFILKKVPRGEHQQIADTSTKYYDGKEGIFLSRFIHRQSAKKVSVCHCLLFDPVFL